MKLLFIPAKSKKGVSLSFQTKKLPNKLGLASTAQFVDSLKSVKKELEKHRKRVFIGKSRHLEEGQVLGCNVDAAIQVKDRVQAFLYIGTGIFHPLAIYLATEKPVFILDPETDELSKLDETTIQRAKAMKRTQEIKFLSANSYGIIVSTKPGQNRMKQALKLKEKLEKKKKKAYIFLCDSFDINQLENWPKIECWINTMCPGLSREQPFVWIEDISI